MYCDKRWSIARVRDSTDLLPPSRTGVNSKKSVSQEDDGYEENKKPAMPRKHAGFERL